MGKRKIWWEGKCCMNEPSPPVCVSSTTRLIIYTSISANSYMYKQTAQSTSSCAPTRTYIFPFLFCCSCLTNNNKKRKKFHEKKKNNQVPVSCCLALVTVDDSIRFISSRKAERQTKKKLAHGKKKSLSYFFFHFWQSFDSISHDHSYDDLIFIRCWMIFTTVSDIASGLFFFSFLFLI